MKTLYEILEVSENASNEIIEKAYRVLAKKYHPDLQPEGKKENAETKMKEVNEAYSVLSNSEKRQEYDQKLEQERQIEEQNKIRQAQAQILQNQNRTMKNEMSESEDITGKSQIPTQEIHLDPKEEKKIKKKLLKQIQEKYQEAYDDYYRSMGYKVPHRWTWKKVKELAITIAILLIIAILLWIIPPTHNLLVGFYEDNIIVKTIVDIIVNIFKAIGRAFQS